MVTGDSQEEVMIFCDRHTNTHTLHHNIYIIILILTGQPPILALLTTRCNVFPVNPAVLIVLQTLLLDNPL